MRRLPCPNQHTIEHTVDLFEEFGCEVEVELTFDVCPGEPMVRYYKDGSGYPGSPATAELREVKVVSVLGEVGETYRKDAPELFAWLDKTMSDRLNHSDMETLFFDVYEVDNDGPED